MPSKSPRPPAFSLIEVVLAIGIVSFALLVIIGLFGGVLRSSSDNAGRRGMSEAVDSLRSYLTETAGFTNTFNWAKAQTNLVYVTYLSDSNGNPDPASQNVVGIWTNSSGTGLNAYDAARAGRWLTAKLKVSPSNPGGTNLTDLNAYAGRASLTILAEIQPIASPGQQAANTSLLQTTMVIMR